MDDICALRYFIGNYPNIATESQVRWWIFNKESNGIVASGAIVKKQSRWYVNIPKLRAWILQGDDQSGASAGEVPGDNT